MQKVALVGLRIIGFSVFNTSIEINLGECILISSSLSIFYYIKANIMKGSS